MFELAKQKIAEHFNLDEKKFNLEWDDCLVELSHPGLYHTITRTDDCCIVGHYSYLPGIRYRTDGSGEPDDYEAIDDFECDSEKEAVEKLIELEEIHKNEMDPMF